MRNKYLRLQQQRITRLFVEDTRTAAPAPPDLLKKYEPKPRPTSPPADTDDQWATDNRGVKVWQGYREFPHEAYPHFIKMSQAIERAAQNFVQQMTPILGPQRAKSYVAQVLERQLEVYGWDRLHGIHAPRGL